MYIFGGLCNSLTQPIRCCCTNTHPFDLTLSLWFVRSPEKMAGRWLDDDDAGQEMCSFIAA